MTARCVGFTRKFKPPRDKIRPEIPANVVQLVNQLMSKSPSDRPQTAREVAKRLAPFARSQTAPLSRTPSRAQTPSLPQAPGPPVSGSPVSGRAQRAEEVVALEAVPPSAPTTPNPAETAAHLPAMTMLDAKQPAANPSQPESDLPPATLGLLGAADPSAELGPLAGLDPLAELGPLAAPALPVGPGLPATGRSRSKGRRAGKWGGRRLRAWRLAGVGHSPVDRAGA